MSPPPPHPPIGTLQSLSAPFAFITVTHIPLHSTPCPTGSSDVPAVPPQPPPNPAHHYGFFPSASALCRRGLRGGGGTEGVKAVINYPTDGRGTATERNRRKTRPAGFLAFAASLFVPQVTLEGCRRSDSSTAPIPGPAVRGGGSVLCTPTPPQPRVPISEECCAALGVTNGAHAGGRAVRRVTFWGDIGEVTVPSDTEGATSGGAVGGHP